MFGTANLSDPGSNRKSPNPPRFMALFPSLISNLCRHAPHVCITIHGDAGTVPKVPHHTSLAPLASHCFKLYLNRGAASRGFCDLSCPLQRDRRQCSCNTPLYRDSTFIHEATRSATSPLSEEVDATGRSSGGVARLSCDTPPNPGKRNATECSVIV